MRRVVGKAEWTGGAANPRFVVTSLKPAQAEARHLLRNDLLRARRDGEPVVVRRMRRYRCTPRSAVRRRLAAGGSGIRTVGPPKMDKAPEIARRAFSRFHSSERLTVRFRASDGSNPASSGSNRSHGARLRHQPRATGRQLPGLPLRTYLRYGSRPRPGDITRVTLRIARIAPGMRRPNLIQAWRPEARHTATGGDRCRPKRGRKKPAQAR